MVKSTLPAVRGKQYVDISVVLNSDSQKNKLQVFIDEIVRCKQRILDENESIKGLREAAVQELNIHPKLLNAMVSLQFNNNYEEKRDEITQLEIIIDTLMQTGD